MTNLSYDDTEVYMGSIFTDVKNIYLPQYPEQEEMLKAFLFGFDVTYAEKKNLNNTTLHAFILKPENFISEAFGIEREILMVYSPYDQLQPRALQAVNMLFGVFPFRNRIDTLNCFVISPDQAIMDNRGITNFGEDQSRAIVPFVYSDLVAHKNDTWYIRNVLRDNFYDVDLFGYTLPLRDESSFFGRKQLVARYIDAIKRCENRGVFGVRKTGKTSLLFKIDRIIREQRLGFVFFYDCKSPSYRKLHWNAFLGEICDNIAKRLGIRIRKEYDEQNIIKSFRYVMKTASDMNKKIIIMFDEIEYISFRSPSDSHWHEEFIDFWQTIWSVQSIHRNLVFILSGVNPSVAEIDTINGIQNPLFGIVQAEYLQGLNMDDVRTMVRVLGRRMGLNFQHDAVEKLYTQYNGHPMLLRLSCSYINRQYENAQRPITIAREDIDRIQNDIDVDLAYYFRHIVSEIQQFYPEEYEMFELLASGQTMDFIELAAQMEYTKHLYHYGLVAKSDSGMPYVKMPVAGRYVAMELAKKENRKSLFKVVEVGARVKWVEQRIKSIIRDIRQLEIATRNTNAPKLFGENSFPEADRFVVLGVVNSESSFSDFFNVCSRCFVESLENYGKSIGNSSYLWTEIKNAYPALFGVLERIKVYRNSADHLVLNATVAQKYHKFWKEDTQGIEDLNEQRFCIQQRLLENFLTAIQIELGSMV